MYNISNNKQDNKSWGGRLAGTPGGGVPAE